MTIELTMLVYSVALLFLLILIQALAGVLAQGLPQMAGSRDNLGEPKPFQARTKRIVDNHREGLALFAPLVLVAAVAHISNPCDGARRAVVLLRARRSRTAVSRGRAVDPAAGVGRGHCRNRAGVRAAGRDGVAQLTATRRAASSASNSGPSFGGLASSVTSIPAAASAALHTGPIETTRVAFNAARNVAALCSSSATVIRLCTCEALVNTTASISERSSRSISAVSGRVSSGNAQR